VTCYEGLVSVTYNNETVKLPAGKTFRVINKEVQDVPDSSTENPSWMQDESSFIGIPLNQVIAELERQYDIKIKTEADLSRFLTTKRKELKYEFYLPTVREMVTEALKIVELATGEKISKISQALEFKPDKLYAVAGKVKRFSTAFSYIYEAYYIAVVAIKYIGDDFFDEEQYVQIAKELFLMEKEHGRVVKYPESFSVPLMVDTLKYLTNLNVLQNENGKYQVQNMRKVNYLIEKFARDVNDQFAINLKFNE
jgi:hypothetical protein